MSSFDISIKVILQHEGGWVDDPHDLGGETNFGISTLIIKNLGLKPRDVGIDQDDFTPGCLKKMPVSAAIAVYKAEFWDKYGFQAILDQTCATKCVDAAVNMGPGNAAKNAQKAVNSLMPGKLVVDGGWGPATFGAINALDPKQFVKAYSNSLLDYYKAIVVARPANAVFLNNWTKRSQWGM